MDTLFSYPLTSEQFKERLDKLCSENPTADKLINGAKLGFTGLAKHLQQDALKRMGIRSETCPYSGATTYYDAQ